MQLWWGLPCGELCESRRENSIQAYLIWTCSHNRNDGWRMEGAMLRDLQTRMPCPRTDSHCSCGSLSRNDQEQLLNFQVFSAQVFLKVAMEWHQQLPTRHWNFVERQLSFLKGSCCSVLCPHEWFACLSQQLQWNVNLNFWLIRWERIWKQKLIVPATKVESLIALVWFESHCCFPLKTQLFTPSIPSQCSSSQGASGKKRQSHLNDDLNRPFLSQTLTDTNMNKIQIDFIKN